jgi:hypothetical protein
MRGRAVLLVLAVLLAGCSGAFTTDRPVEGAPTATDDPGATTAPPTATADPAPSSADPSPTTTAKATPRPPSPTPRRAGKVSVSGRRLSFDEEAVYRDVVELHGQSYDTAPDIDLVVTRRPSPARSGQVFDTTPFMRLWGFDASAVNDTAIAGLAIRKQVFLYTDPTRSTTDRKIVLAHEYTHVLQYDGGAFGHIRRGIREDAGNTRQVYLAVVEGSASYAEARYAAEHLDEPYEQRSWSAYSANSSRLGALLLAPYYFGERYVRERVDSVANLSAVYDDPPTTTEQVVHGDAPGEEPPRPLVVEVHSTADSGWDAREPRIRGELFVRLVLEGQLAPDRAAEAAAGWGADRVVTFENASTNVTASAYAWVLRWDDPGEAREFEAAMTAYLDGRADRSDGRWRDGTTTFDLRRVSEETVVVLAGPDPFVAHATVDGGNGSVGVTAGGTTP